MIRILLCIVLFGIAGVGLAQDAPDALVRNTTQEVLGIIKQDKDIRAGDSKKVLDLVESKVLPHFNFTRMTQLAVGRPWRDASAAQQQNLVTEFRTLLVRTYSTALELYKNQTIEVKPLVAQPADTEVTVRTVINQPGGQPIPMDYRMEKTDKGWKVYDVAIENVSIVTNYRSQFAAEVQRGGIDGLIKTLRDKNVQLASRSGDKK
ncbi:MAG TPA: ABC transporter substrate-binding protein [Burkholderiales bacterium]|nr:ABC transporter substrate-binding protein [Burkholderiales bacterium]